MKKIIPVLSLVAIESRGVEVSLSGTGWTCDGVAVTVPHTWNEKDGSDGLGVPKVQPGHNSVSSRSYCRKSALYVRDIEP